MNHTYRLVFNRALGVVQAVSELASAGRGGRSATTAHGLRRTPLALACAGLLGMASFIAARPAAAGDIVIPGIDTPGNYSVDTLGPGNISQTGAILVGGATSMVAGGTITLTNAGNDFVGAVSLTGGSTQITDQNALTLGALDTGALTVVNFGALNLGSGSIGGNLSASSNGGTIGQTGALNVSGSSLLDAGGGNITLTNAGNDFVGAVNLTGGTTQITDKNALTLGTLDTGALTVVSTGALNLGSGSIGGNLSASSNGGAIGQAGALNVSGNSLLDAGGGNITLTNAGNDFVGAVDLSGGSTQINDANALTLGTLDTGALTAVSHGALNLGTGAVGGDLAVTSNDGAITQAGALDVTGTNTIDAGTGSITLTQANNDFAGTVNLSGGATQVTDRNALALGNLSTGALTATSTGALNLGIGSVNGNLVATSNNGAISQTGALNVAGTSTLDAGNNTIALANAGNDFTNVVASGGGMSLSDANDLSVALTMTGDSTLNAGGSLTVGGRTRDLTTNAGATSFDTTMASGNLWATSSGAISQTGALSVTGTSRFDAGANAIILTNVGNDFVGAVNLTGGTTQITDTNQLLLGTLATGDLTAISLAAQLGLGQGSITGNLVANSGGSMTQTGALGVTGTSTLNATGSIILNNTSNDFTGTVSASAGGGVFISDANDLAIASLASGPNSAVTLIAGGTLSLPGGAIDTGTANLTLASNGGSLTTPGVSGASISLTGRDGLTLAGSVNGSTVTLDTTNAAITQGGVLTASLLTGNSGTGDVTLANAGNAIGTLGDFTAGNFSLTNSQALAITGALSASGNIHLHDDAGITVTGAVNAGGSTTLDAGTALTIGNGGTTGTLTGNVVDNGALAFSRSDNIAFTGTISGSGLLSQFGTGTLTLDGNSSAFTGFTLVSKGTLLVGSVAGNGAALGGDVTVASGATLGGHGAIGGNVAVAGSAHLAPGNSIGTLTIGGDLTLAQDAQLDYEFGTPGADFSTPGNGDSVIVGGNLTLDGAVLNVTDAGGMGPGLYNLFTWGGSLTETNGGIVFGTTPAGEILSLQTLTGSKQINLLNTTGMTLNFWNGNGLASATQMGGGDGTWSTTSTNWTDATGSVSAAMQPQPGFAIFGGAAGTVTVDNTNGAVSATGLQFASDGYKLQGDTLTVVGNGTDAPVIRVGDGSSAGAAYTATIDNVIAGNDGIAKTDAGTLVLTADNLFSGGVAVNGGELSVSRDANLGDAGNALTLDGGLLRVTGTAFNATARDIVLGGNGGGFDIADAGNVFTVQQQLDGSGAFVKTGAGTLVLGADNSFSGGTTIGAGTLQLGNGGTTGSIVGDVVDNGVLAFNRSDDVAFSGIVSGTGALQQLGTGTVVLTADNTFSGGTVISAGTLQVGDGGTTGTITGDVVDNGILAFDRSDAVTFAGAISGSGSLRQLGTGTLVLDGDSSAFAGSTEVVEGILLVGGVADNGAVLGGDVAVASGARLGGHGEIGGSVTNAGTLAPGASIGTLTIHGDYTQTATGTFEVEVTPDGQADLLAADGSATLAGGTVVVAIDGNWKPRTDYTILTAAGGVSGQFDSASSNLVFLDAILGYGANAVTLSLQRNDIAFASLAGTRNQRATAAAADTLGWGNSAYAALAMLDAAGAPRAFDTLSGEVHATTRLALLDDSRYLREAINRRLQPVDGGASDGGWIAAWGHGARSDSDGNAAALRSDGLGFAIGADREFGARARLGVVAGSSRLTVRADARASVADVDSRHLGAYGSFDTGWLRLQAGATRSWQQVGSQRAVAFAGYDDTLQADYDARTTQAYLDGSHAFAIGRGSLAPFLNLAQVRVRSDAFHESGGDAALRVEAASDERTYATLGMRWSAALGARDALRLQGSVGWTHAFDGNDAVVNRQRFLGGIDPFEIAGTPIADNALAFDAGVRWQADPRVVIDAGYVGRFASDARDQGVRLTLDWAF